MFGKATNAFTVKMSAINSTSNGSATTTSRHLNKLGKNLVNYVDNNANANKITATSSNEMKKQLTSKLNGNALPFNPSTNHNQSIIEYPFDSTSNSDNYVINTDFVHNVISNIKDVTKSGDNVNVSVKSILQFRLLKAMVIKDKRLVKILSTNNKNHNEFTGFINPLDVFKTAIANSRIRVSNAHKAAYTAIYSVVSSDNYDNNNVNDVNKCVTVAINAYDNGYDHIGVINDVDVSKFSERVISIANSIFIMAVNRITDDQKDSYDRHVSSDMFIEYVKSSSVMGICSYVDPSSVKDIHDILTDSYDSIDFYTSKVSIDDPDFEYRYLDKANKQKLIDYRNNSESNSEIICVNNSVKYLVDEFQSTNKDINDHSLEISITSANVNDIKDIISVNDNSIDEYVNTVFAVTNDRDVINIYPRIKNLLFDEFQLSIFDSIMSSQRPTDHFIEVDSHDNVLSINLPHHEHIAYMREHNKVSPKCFSITNKCCVCDKNVPDHLIPIHNKIFNDLISISDKVSITLNIITRDASVNELFDFHLLLISLRNKFNALVSIYTTYFDSIDINFDVSYVVNKIYNNLQYAKKFYNSIFKYYDFDTRFTVIDTKSKFIAFAKDIHPSECPSNIDFIEYYPNIHDYDHYYDEMYRFDDAYNRICDNDLYEYDTDAESLYIFSSGKLCRGYVNIMTNKEAKYIDKLPNKKVQNGHYAITHTYDSLITIY